MVLLGGTPRCFSVGVRRRTPSTSPQGRRSLPAPARGQGWEGQGYWPGSTIRVIFQEMEVLVR